IVAKTLGDLNDQVVLLVVDGVVGDQKSCVDRRQLCLLEFNGHYRTHDLSDFTNVFSHLILLSLSPVFASGRYPLRASAPPTISISSAVMAACLALLYASVSRSSMSLHA